MGSGKVPNLLSIEVTGSSSCKCQYNSDCHCPTLAVRRRRRLLRLQSLWHSWFRWSPRPCDSCPHRPLVIGCARLIHPRLDAGPVFRVGRCRTRDITTRLVETIVGGGLMSISTLIERATYRRNIMAALGSFPLKWLRFPGAAVTHTP